MPFLTFHITLILHTKIILKETGPVILGFPLIAICPLAF